MLVPRKFRWGDFEDYEGYGLRKYPFTYPMRTSHRLQRSRQPRTTLMQAVCVKFIYVALVENPLRLDVCAPDSDEPM